MTTVIVPTDFSETANNAARYAARMLHGQDEAKLLLFNVYEKESEEAETEASLIKLKDELKEGGAVTVDTRCEESGDIVGSLTAWHATRQQI